MQKLMTYSMGLVILLNASSCALLDSWGICHNDGSILGCAADDLVNDAGEPDAGEPDVINPDAGEPNGSELDAGELDAGESDAGVDEPKDPAHIHEFPRWPLPIDPPASNYQDNGNGTITDKTTSLIWEKEISPNNFTYAEAISYCNELGLANQSDWHLPSAIELLSLVNHGISNPASTFPNTPSEFFWSSTLVAGDANQAGSVFFSFGVDVAGNINVGKRARCVRAGANQADLTKDQYTVTNETVTDNFTGLIWQRVLPSGTFTQAQAITFCNNLTLAGSSNWRVPHVKELLSISDRTRHAPSIDPTAFPDTPSESFWSSTPVSGDTSQAWGIDFDDGFNNGFFVVDNDIRIRCVR